MQKSIEDLDATVKENKDEIKSLMDRTQALETQNTEKDNKIKELIDEINDTQQHQRNFSLCIKGLPVTKEYKDEEFLKYVYTQAIQPTLEFAKLKGEISQVPEYDKVIEHGHVLPSRSSPAGSRTRFSQNSTTHYPTFSTKTHSNQGYQVQLPCLKPSGYC